MSSNEVVKGVAKKLKYYFEIKRLEDGFDLSDIHQPQLDHPPLKVRPALQYDGLHDRALKHYFSQPDVRVQLTQLNGQNARGTLQGKRELQVRRMLENYMKHYTFQKNPLPSCYYVRSRKGCTHVKPEITGALPRRKKQKNLIGGWPVLRTVPDQHISKGEAARLVNSATKIIVGSDLYNNVDVSILHTTKKEKKEKKERRRQSAPRSFEKKAPARPATAKSPSRRRKVTPVKPKAYDDSYIIKRHTPEPPPPRARSPTPSQSTSTTAATTTATSTTDDKSTSRPRSAKYRSRTVINVPERRQQEEVAVIRSTQTAVDYDVDRDDDRQKIEKFDKLEEEVTDGPWCEYQIYVRTGDRIGAGTKAPIKLTMYGEKGRTKEFVLNKRSKKNKLPFQKGREDVFLLPAHHIGRIRKIQIGHDRPELNFSWFLDNVTVYDMHAKRIFQFPCDKWMSGHHGDKRTYRILNVDREKDFIDALDESMTKSPRSQEEASESDSSNAGKGKKVSVNGKGKDNYSMMVRPGDVSSSSDSESVSSRSTSSSSSDDSRAKKFRGKAKKKNSPKDDYVPKDTMITLHSVEDSKPVDEIIISARGRDAKPKTAEDYVQGYKAALEANDQDRKKQLEKEREMERKMLQGKTIHEAVKDGDIERVKDLLHHFPEMRDSRDGSGWTPLHLAAGRGNKDMLKWLVTSDADINAETPTGYNAMHIAAMNGHVNSMMFLQAMGSSIHGVTVEKETALHLAAKSGHLECVKWLVANRASLVLEDAHGRIPLTVAEEYSRDACADFLRVCMRELANPKSTFAKIHGRRMSGSGLPPIEEDAYSGSSSSRKRDDADVRPYTSSDSEDENRNKKKSESDENDLRVRLRVTIH